ncbi:tetratricopeptide repeat protein [Luteimonas aestuarii]|uniref:Tetratricopeptide repeat protein n=1 Tax=Luteimonas aestuarii TaxID=453837 RepID=A0A4V3ALA4_9GAMM|nr:tetratricopeptide repeat protein [Luteimonas aestuarii]TDK19958.1 tetratricopeptide repeat protein [Luteimonas aestuarii]
MTYAFFALLLAIAALAAVAIVWPLRSTSPRVFGAVVLLVPLLTLGLYTLVGTPAGLDPAAARLSEIDTPESLEAAIAELQAELERNPTQVEGWALLARSRAMQGRFAEARDAYVQALMLLPDDANLLVEAAEARAQANEGNRFDDEAIAMLQRALAIDPESQRAPWFLGIAQRQRGQDAEAAATWEALLPRLDASTAAALRQQIVAAREAAGLPPDAVIAAPVAPDAAQPVEAAADGLRVRVALDPDFAARVRLRGDSVVFVIARVPGGPPMPVAVQRHPLQALPLDIVLGDGDSPMPTQKLSALREVEVFARLSASGDAARSDGDLESAAVRVALPSSAPVELVIGE